eukprot:1161481-Pelagomonas_calceolata.AAC.9
MTYLWHGAQGGICARPAHPLVWHVFSAAWCARWHLCAACTPPVQHGVQGGMIWRCRMMLSEAWCAWPVLQARGLSAGAVIHVFSFVWPPYPKFWVVWLQGYQQHPGVDCIA